MKPNIVHEHLFQQYNNFKLTNMYHINRLSQKFDLYAHLD